MDEVTSTLGSAETGPLMQEGETGLYVDQARLNAEGAVSAAVDTGGTVIANLASGLRQISDESRTYYLLGYRPTGKQDGRFHKIEVTVARPGVTVRARRGYYAQAVKRVEEADTDTRLSPEVREALETPGESAGIPLRLPSFVLAPAAGGSAKGEKEPPPGAVNVELLGEADLQALHLEQKGGRATGALDYYVTVTGRDTGFRAAEQQHLELSLDAPRREELATRGVPLLRQFKLSPGTYQARLVVRDPRSGRLGSVRHDFDVPFPGLRLTTPIVTDAVDTSGGAPRPLLVAHRTFAPGRAVVASFEVLGARAGARVVSGFTLTGPGGLTIARMEPTPIAPAPDGRLSRALRLPVPTQPGEYELTLTVRDEGAGQTVTDVERFTIAGQP
jgi:hypothetical protein